MFHPHHHHSHTAYSSVGRASPSPLVDEISTSNEIFDSLAVYDPYSVRGDAEDFCVLYDACDEDGDVEEKRSSGLRG
jgi:hypothetical protein